MEKVWDQVKKTYQNFVHGPNFKLNMCMLWVCFGYYYKSLCGPLGGICKHHIMFIDVNHWLELLVYCPLLWISLNTANRIVFRDNKSDTPGFHTFSHKTRKWLGMFAIALNLYGMGIHAAANPIEIYSREYMNMNPDLPNYRLTFFLDENVSHWIQFIPFFFAIGWYVINDKTGRYSGPYMSVFMGVGHGVDRAIGVIEGNSWYFGIPMSGWLLITCYFRYLKYGKKFSLCIEDYFFRHALAIGITIPLCQLIYFILFGGFHQPSEVGSHWPYIYMVIFTFGGAIVFFLVDTWRRKQFPVVLPGSDNGRMSSLEDSISTKQLLHTNSSIVMSESDMADNDTL